MTILIGCFEVPGWGGAATSGYRLFERLQRDGHDVAFLSLVERRDVSFFRFVFGDGFGNPDGLRDVHVAVLEEPLPGPQPALRARLDALGPSVVVGRGHVASRLMFGATPGAHHLYMTTGSATAKLAVGRRLATDHRDLLARLDRAAPLPVSAMERQAVLESDVVLAHSPLVADLLPRLFPRQAGKLVPGILWNPGAVEHLTGGGRDGAADGGGAAPPPFAERDIDVLFAANSWRRREKNAGWVTAIAERCPELSVHVVGEWPDGPAGVTHHGFVPDRAAFSALLDRSRVLASCSRWDAAPDVLFEAAGRGCNVVASRNCGNWTLCPAELVVDPFTIDGFVEAIRLAREGPLLPNTGPFLDPDPYAELVDILTVLP